MDSETKPQKPFPQFIDKNPKKHFHWSLFIVLSLAIVAGLLIAIQKFKIQEEIDSDVFNNPRLKSIKTNPEAEKSSFYDSDIKSWQNYSDLGNNFEFSFPKAFNLQSAEKGGKVYAISKPLILMRIKVSNTLGPIPGEMMLSIFNDSMKTQSNYKLLQGKKLTVGYNDALIVEATYDERLDSGFKNLEIYALNLQDDAHSIVISFHWESKDFNTQQIKKLAEQVMSTFKFIREPSRIDQTK